jgi:hypothetical protein
MRGLADLCGTNAFSNAHDGQKLVFNIVDVVLTAAVLAGGANGIHFIVNAVTTFADATSDKTQQSANGQSRVVVANISAFERFARR